MSCCSDVLPLSVTRRKTFNILINKALEIFEQGRVPSVAELASEAGISRATAYRYFPTQSDLMTAAVDASLQPIVNWEPHSETIPERIGELLEFACPLILKHEGALRLALLVSLQQWATECASPEKRGKKWIPGIRCKEMLTKAMGPLNDHWTPEMGGKVLAACSLLYSAESLLMIKDAWNMNNQQVTQLMQWMGKAVLNQAMAESHIPELKAY